MPQEMYCHYKGNHQLREGKPGRNPCEWFDVNWDEFNARSQYKPNTLGEADDLKVLEESFLHSFLRIWALMHEPEPPELEADIEESGVEILCLDLAPVRGFLGGAERVHLSKASSDFSRRARGLPLVIVGGEEEAE